MNVECPVCGSTKGVEINLHTEGFARVIIDCTVCDSISYDFMTKENRNRPVSGVIETIDEFTNNGHTKYSSMADEFVAEDQGVWFS